MSGYTPQSGEYITDLGGSIVNLKRIDLRDVRMGSVRYKSALIEKCNGGKTIKQRKGRCVQDYIYSTCKGEPGFLRYTLNSLTEEINRFVHDKRKRPSTREILAWRDALHTNVSIYSLDPFFNKFVSSPAPRILSSHGREGYIRLCFMCKGNHCFPILNHELVTKISKGKGSVLKHLDMIEWSTRHEEDKILRCNDISDYYDTIYRFGGKEKKNIENHLIVYYQTTIKREMS